MCPRSVFKHLPWQPTRPNNQQTHSNDKQVQASTLPRLLSRCYKWAKLQLSVRQLSKHGHSVTNHSFSWSDKQKQTFLQNPAHCVGLEALILTKHLLLTVSTTRVPPNQQLHTSYPTLQAIEAFPKGRHTH